MNLKSFLKDRVVKNASWLIGGQLLNKVLSFLVSILTARYLGPGNYGLINYAAAYTTFFASICSLGINSIIVKNFSDHPTEEGETLGTTLLLRALSSLLSAVMIVGIVFIADSDDPLTITVVALSSISMIFQVYDSFNYWFQARLESKYSAIASNIAYIVSAGYKILLLVLEKDVRWFAVVNSVDYLTAACFLFAIYKRRGGPKLSFSIKKSKQLLSNSKSFIISGLMVSIYASTDKLMLKQMLDETSVGYYSLASSISVMWAFVLSAAIDSMYPVIVQLHKTDYIQYERKNRQLYAIVFYASILMSAIIALCATPLISLLYGTDYLPAVQPLRIVVWYTAFSYLGVARNAWMVCENKQKYLKYLYISAAFINVALNYILIPIWGTSGAAAASLITQMSTTILLPAVISPLRRNARLMADAVLFRDVLPEKSVKQGR